MATSKKISSFEQYLLSGKLRSDGFQRCRYSFCANSVATGAEKRFFVELYLVNPSVSPNVPVIAQRNRVSTTSSAAEIQGALTSGFDSRYSEQEVLIRPSYLLVKAGVLGQGGKQMNDFIAPSQFVYAKQNASIRTEQCEFSFDTLTGSISVSEAQIRACPEMLCNAGEIKWNVRFDKSSEIRSPYNDSLISWIPLGTRARFAGNVILDGEEYEVTPEKSFGYIDKSWGKSLPNPYFHVSSSRLVSIISGKPLRSSSFALEGEFSTGKLCGVLSLESRQFFFGKSGILDGTKETHGCASVPSSDDGEKLHWTMSVVKGGIVIDLDVFCRADEMFVRDYEVPQGKRTLLKVLGGGTGSGEVRVYKKHGKNLELLEHANIYDALCEFGRIEEIGSGSSD